MLYGNQAHADEHKLFQEVWDGRLAWGNVHNVHGFVAAQEQARQLNLPVPMDLPVTQKQLNAEAVDGFFRSMDVFAIPRENHFSQGFHEAMEELGATMFVLPMPAPHHAYHAVALPKSEEASRQAAQILRSGGLWDLKTTFDQILAGQFRHPNAVEVPLNEPTLSEAQPKVSEETPVSPAPSAKHSRLR